MTDVDKNEQLVVSFFETLSNNDLEGIRALLHEDASWTPMVKEVPGAGVHTPRDVIVDEFLAPVRGMFSDGPRVVVDNVFAKGDSVCAETRAMGTLANGNDYNNQYCWCMDIKDGKIFAIREYMDSHYVMSVV